MTTSIDPWPAPPVHRGLVTIEPLGTHLVDLDTAAYLASPNAIDAHSAGRWPIAGFTREQNLGLLAEHEREHDAGEAFAYAMLDDGRSRELGCVYLRRLDDFISRTGTLLDDVGPGAAIGTFWALDDTSARPSATALLGEIMDWCDAWGAAPVVLRALPAEQESIAAMTALGMEELLAREQPLPYRWFRRRSS